jgi:hypothetical protein
LSTATVTRKQGEVQDTHPHACALSGVVLMGVVVVDEETGEEVEVLDAVECRRCAESWPSIK